MPKIRAVKCL